MKQLLWLSVLITLVNVTTSPVRAAESTDRFVEIYFLIQAGDAARAANDPATAIAKYGTALGLLNDIKKNKPDWYPEIVNYRIKYCTQHLEALGTAPPPVPAATAAPAPPPSPIPGAETEQLQQLNSELQKAQTQISELQQARTDLASQLTKYREQTTSPDTEAAKKAQDQLIELRTINTGLTAKLEEAQAAAAKAAVSATELQQARDNIRQLEASQKDFNTKLQDALAKVPLTQTNPQVEELFKKNADLTAQLATAQNKITELIATATNTAVAMADQIQLRADLTQVRQELEQVRTENQSLKKSRDDALAQLAESDRQLRGARASAGKNDELISQLRRENTLMRDLIQGTTPATAKRGSNVEDKAYANELRNWRPRRRPPASSTSVSASANEKLVATLSAPAVPPTETKPPSPPPVTPPPTPSPKPTPPPVVVHTEPASTSPVTDAEKESAPKLVVPLPSPETPALLDEARAALAQKDFDGAAAKYEKVLEREPDNMRALANLAVIRYQQGKMDEAETVLRKTIATQPNDSGARSMMGVIHFRKGRMEEAYNELTRAVALDPRNSEAHNYLGIVMNEKGWPAAAEQEIRRAIELNPKYADAHFNLAVLYARQKTPRYELARYHYRQAMDLGAARDEQLEALLKADADKKDAKPAK